MTKQQEIDQLQAFADSLPKDSYLADWLRHALPEIATDIRGDVFPSVLPDAAKKEADQIIAKAKAEAAGIIEKATKEAGRLREQSENKWKERQRQLARYECAAIEAAKNLIKAIQEIQ